MIYSYNKCNDHASNHVSNHASVQVEKLVSALTGGMGRSELQELLSIKNVKSSLYYSTTHLSIFRVSGLKLTPILYRVRESLANGRA